MVDNTSRADVNVLVKKAIAAADPEQLVHEFLASFDFSPSEKIFVIGAGKAGGSMALGVEKAMRGAGPGEAAGPGQGPEGAGPSRRITDGLVVVKDGYMVEGLERVRQVEAAHPIPDGRGVDAARDLLELAGRAGESDLVICLISGGGSALTALPAPGLSLGDLQQTVTELLRSGADIGEVNAVRKHLTMAAAGRLAEVAFPAKLLTLIISDVLGDALDVIASGPTVPDESSFSDALEVLERYGLMGKAPPAVAAHLQSGVAGEIEETPKPGAEVFRRAENHILASNRTAVNAAASAAEGLGYSVLQLEEPIFGETRDAAARLVAQAREQASGRENEPAGEEALTFKASLAHKKASGEPKCIIAGGETTVTVTGDGTGGRAQEFALAAALAIDGLDNVLVFAFGTDGTDGFTDAAGAMADGTSVARAQALGLDPVRHLRDNDSFPFFNALGDLIVTGPTRTNVNDIYGVLINP
ncbi:MAG: glycerate kinase type-2 family protein [Thermoleophilia bacterium]